MLIMVPFKIMGEKEKGAKVVTLKEDIESLEGVHINIREQ